LDDLEVSGDVAIANLGAWIRPARLIATLSPDLLVIGAPHAPAQRRIAKQFTRPIERALSRVLGRETKVEVVVTSSWQGRFGATDPESEQQAG
jgi:chromosomal replication initiation ATPase DnaA